MCDPITLIGGALGLFGGLMSMGQTQPEPPKAETPAIAAPTSRAPGATVRLGQGSEDDVTNNLNPDTGQPVSFTTKRASANSLGNLGRSGLAL